jgi:hypothetical protein
MVSLSLGHALSGQPCRRDVLNDATGAQFNHK